MNANWLPLRFRLPQGAWLEWPGLEGAGRVREGGQYVIADGPLDTVPVWLRAGGAVARADVERLLTGS